MGNDDRRHPQPLDDVDHLVAVDSAIDSVLMLDDSNIVLVQDLASCRHGSRRTFDQLTDHPAAR